MCVLGGCPGPGCQSIPWRSARGERHCGSGKASGLALAISEEHVTVDLVVRPVTVGPSATINVPPLDAESIKLRCDRIGKHARASHEKELGDRSRQSCVLRRNCERSCVQAPVAGEDHGPLIFSCQRSCAERVGPATVRSIHDNESVVGVHQSRNFRDQLRRLVAVSTSDSGKTDGAQRVVRLNDRLNCSFHIFADR